MCIRDRAASGDAASLYGTHVFGGAPVCLLVKAAAVGKDKCDVTCRAANEGLARAMVAELKADLKQQSIA